MIKFFVFFVFRFFQTIPFSSAALWERRKNNLRLELNVCIQARLGKHNFRVLDIKEIHIKL